MTSLTPWFPAAARPTRNGRYQAQDIGMNCSCCWIELEWRNGEWFSDLCERGRFNTHFFTSNLKRWRGLASQAKKEPQQ